jgi:hypothetical protein
VALEISNGEASPLTRVATDRMKQDFASSAAFPRSRLSTRALDVFAWGAGGA